MESICPPLAELAPRSDVQIVYLVLCASAAMTIARNGAR
jgi:hypothetical protein